MTTPKVSIGLAVYNGEAYLAAAIQSILQQTFTDFELIISDNASTDRTRTICQHYAAQDRRIRYHRNATNIGGANNENLTFTLARGQYFRLAAHDDLCAPELLAQCVAVLDRDPAVVLCYTATHYINEDGRLLNTTRLQKGLLPRPSQRFRELAFRDHFCEPTYGLMRADILRKTQLQQNYTDSDRVFLCALALRGRFFEVAEPLFYKRFHPKNAHVDWRARMAWFNPAWKGKIVFPHWLQFFDYLRIIAASPIPLAEKARCYGTMVRWLATFGKNMAKDLWVALVMALHSPTWRTKDTHVYNWE